MTAGQQDGTTANERPMTMASAEAAKRLGPLIRNQVTNHMGLDNYPKRCGCRRHPPGPERPDDGTTHEPGEPCPFKQDNFPVGMLVTCCALRGKVAVYALNALGEFDLANRMFDDMSADEAEEFSAELRVAADRLQSEYAGKAKKTHSAGWNGIWGAGKKGWKYQDHSTFEEAITAIREAARWYEKVAQLGYGVRASY